ncbi:MAG: transglutaminase-like domain-containing protein, partial [Verrucomicrobiota bacterium]
MSKDRQSLYPTIAHAISLVAASLAAWMLTGSPLPALFSVALAVMVLILRPLFRTEKFRIVLRVGFVSLCLGAAYWQFVLFHSGAAFSFRADPPGWFHGGFALLWCGIGELGFRVRSGLSDPLPLLLSLSGGCLFLGGAVLTELYDYSAFEVFPVAAIPTALALGGILPSWVSPSLRALSTAAGVLLLAVVTPQLHSATEYLTEWMRADSEDSSPGLAESAPAIGSGGPFNDGSSRRIPREVDIKLSNQTRVFLSFHSATELRKRLSQPVYLRTSTVTIFESDELISPVRSGRWIYDLDDGSPDGRIRLLDRPSSPSSLHTFFIDSLSATSIPMLPGSNELRTNAVYEFGNDWFQLSPSAEKPRLRYSAMTSGDPIQVSFSRRLEDFIDKEAPGIYLNLPPSPFAARIRAEMQTHSLSTFGEFREHLLKDRRYSLQYTTPDNLSPIENFLFGKREGHCELFAAGSVLLLRAAGIPARIAYGYSGGVVDHEQRILAFRDRDFHSWSEVLSPDGQWLIFESTPDSSFAAVRTAESRPLAEENWDSYEDLTENALAAAGSGFSFHSWLAGWTSFLSGHFPLLLALLVIATSLCWWLLSRNRRSKDMTQSGSPVSVPSHLSSSPSRLFAELQR